MAFYEAYSHPALIRYKTSVCTKATLFLAIVMCLTYIPPLLVAYRSQGTLQSCVTLLVVASVVIATWWLYIGVILWSLNTPNVNGFIKQVSSLARWLKPCHFRFLDKKKHLWGTAGCEVPVPDFAGGSDQHSGRLRRLEHLSSSEQHAWEQSADPCCLCKTLTTVPSHEHHLCLCGFACIYTIITLDKKYNPSL